MALHDNEPPHQPRPASSRPSSFHAKDLFKIPAPVRRLFDQFPFVTYPSNDLPKRSPIKRDIPSLYIFTTPILARDGAPSFNPSCLKWQAYLKFAGIEILTIPSNNHASPTGALPFLLPSRSGSSASPDALLPIPSNKLQKWVHEQTSSPKEPSSLKYTPYLSLLDNKIRNAWLYALYLSPENFSAVAQRLYIDPCSSNSIVRATISHQLRAAAEAEILKQSAMLDVDTLFSEANDAFEALNTLLGDVDWFFDAETPGLFDASVFAYTYLILDKGLGWKDERLMKTLRGKEGLVRHCERIFSRYFGQSKT
ncbi:MAG: hypothetical protein M1812_006033 [Candelaria pacifica]|nr:MAG: hypothetical protein M1812_006033 [Candelaria pacifica]